MIREFLYSCLQNLSVIRILIQNCFKSAYDARLNEALTSARGGVNLEEKNPQAHVALYTKYVQTWPIMLHISKKCNTPDPQIECVRVVDVQQHPSAGKHSTRHWEWSVQPMKIKSKSDSCSRAVASRYSQWRGETFGFAFCAIFDVPKEVPKIFQT